VQAAVNFTVTTHGRLDVAFNNAGVKSVDPLSEITEEKYRTVFDINVLIESLRRRAFRGRRHY
jgi:meso-butanediol dehydrogenase / (S,S)-butanediol dehydrogenase / diacetyl reductase